ncbi:MAG TPA: hypothetical protein VG944_03750 [Fimbriimonas sp.]|nr:hypothetical protein [Fimbriimonas sp.]
MLFVSLAGVAFASDADWHSYKINAAEVTFLAPSKPSVQQATLNGAPSTLYTSDSPAGRFVVGYTPFPASSQPAMKKILTSDPGSPGIKHLIESTVAAFAKAGKAKIGHAEFGLDKGLPTEFATLSNSRVTLNLRVYVSSKRVYVFVAAGDDEAVSKFFQSIKVPSEVAQPK